LILILLEFNWILICFKSVAHGREEVRWGRGIWNWAGRKCRLGREEELGGKEVEVLREEVDVGREVVVEASG
jgi:hypothetical protein